MSASHPQTSKSVFIILQQQPSLQHSTISSVVCETSVSSHSSSQMFLTKMLSMTSNFPLSRTHHWQKCNHSGEVFCLCNLRCSHTCSSLHFIQTEQRNDTLLPLMWLICHRHPDRCYMEPPGGIYLLRCQQEVIEKYLIRSIISFIRLQIDCMAWVMTDRWRRNENRELSRGYHCELPEYTEQDTSST